VLLSQRNVDGFLLSFKAGDLWGNVRPTEGRHWYSNQENAYDIIAMGLFLLLGCLGQCCVNARRLG
jgi:hypothetical protein